MMYSNKFAAAVKVGGKILREFDDTVYVPFGSEYSLYFKNLNNVRAGVSVSIDGKDILDGTELIVSPNGTLDLERSILNSNLSLGNKLKFIERTSAIENHRGVGGEDGLIRIEFRFEDKVQSDLKKLLRDVKEGKVVMSGSMGNGGLLGGQHRNDNYYGGPYFNDKYCASSLDAVGSTIDGTRSRTLSSKGMGGMMMMNCSAQASYAAPAQEAASMDWMNCEMKREVQTNDVGITVPGAVSHQSFKVIDDVVFETVTHVLVFKIKGGNATKKVETAITVNAKPECKFCGKLNSSTSKFCTECGAGLIIV
jgi:hypothetical protein